MLAKRVGGQPASLSGEAWQVLRREPLHWFDAEGSNARDGGRCRWRCFMRAACFAARPLSALHDAGLSGEVRLSAAASAPCATRCWPGWRAPLPASLAAPGMRSQRQPAALPACELVGAMELGEPHPAAERLWGLFASGWGR